MKVTIIGAGNMGGALARGWYKAGDVELTVTARTQSTLDRIKSDCPDITVTTDNVVAVRGADIVVLAVKPWLAEQIVNEIKYSIDMGTQIFVSVAAGVSLAQLDALLDTDYHVVLAMPNIASEYGESMTFVTDDCVKALFDKVGTTMVVSEKQLAAGMMMAGCGIAYVMRFLRAMQEGGVEMGFYAKDALQIACQTMQGALTLLAESGLHPEAAIDRVTTPGGVTIKGLNELDHAGFNSAVVRCLKAGFKK